MNFKALLALPKTARSAQTHKSISFIEIVWSTLYVYLWPPVENSTSRSAIPHTLLNAIKRVRWIFLQLIAYDASRCILSFVTCCQKILRAKKICILQNACRKNSQRNSKKEHKCFHHTHFLKMKINGKKLSQFQFRFHGLLKVS